MTPLRQQLATIIFVSLYICSFTERNVLWSYNLQGAGAVLDGNAAMVSQDGSQVFVTVNDGSLHIVETNNLLSSTVFEPTPLSSTSKISCQSGVALYETKEEGVRFATYAVTDTDTDGTKTSRVIAVNKEANELWSVEVDGEVAGTPFVNANGTRIYLTHNAPSQDTSFTGENTGSISVIAYEQNESSLLVTLPDQNQVLGPLTPVTGRTVTLNGSTKDVIAFARKSESSTRASNNFGGVYLLIQSIRGSSSTGSSYEVRLASNHTLTALARPSLSMDATKLYLSQDKEIVSGWDDIQNISKVLYGEEQNVAPRWSESFAANSQSISASLTSPIISLDETMIFVATSNLQVVGISTTIGQAVWVNNVSGIHLADPVVVENNDGTNNSMRVYCIEAKTAIIRELDSLSGILKWEANCTSFSGDSACFISVEADFSILSALNIMYFASTNGTLFALSLAPLETLPSPSIGSTSSPAPAALHAVGGTRTAVPSIQADTGKIINNTISGAGIPDPSIDANTESAASAANSSNVYTPSPHLAIILGAIFGVSVLAIIIALFLFNRKNKSKKSSDDNNGLNELRLGISEANETNPEPILTPQKALLSEVDPDFYKATPPLTPEYQVIASASSLDVGAMPAEFENPSDVSPSDSDEDSETGFEIGLTNAIDDVDNVNSTKVVVDYSDEKRRSSTESISRDLSESFRGMIRRSSSKDTQDQLVVDPPSQLLQDINEGARENDDHDEVISKKEVHGDATLTAQHQVNFENVIVNELSKNDRKEKLFTNQ